MLDKAESLAQQTRNELVDAIPFVGPQLAKEGKVADALKFLDPLQNWVNGMRAAMAGDLSGAFLSTASVINEEKAVANVYVKDFATKETKNWSAMFKSEGEARALAREKLGANPVEVEANKWRSADGRWQYRAKPGDVVDNHIHLEQLNPQTGEVLQNLHLRWPEGAGR